MPLALMCIGSHPPSILCFFFTISSYLFRVRPWPYHTLLLLLRRATWLGGEGPPTFEAPLHAPSLDSANYAQFEGPTMSAPIDIYVQATNVFISTIRRGPRRKHTPRWAMFSSCQAILIKEEWPQRSWCTRGKAQQTSRSCLCFWTGLSTQWQEGCKDIFKSCPNSPIFATRLGTYA